MNIVEQFHHWINGKGRTGFFFDVQTVEDFLETLDQTKPSTLSKEEIEREAEKGNKIYVASKTKHAQMWKDYRSLGANIISTWIDKVRENEPDMDLRDLILRCCNEASQCDFLILYIEPGEILKCALVEAGIALASGKPVIVVGQSEHFVSETFLSHPLVWTGRNINDAFHFIPPKGAQWASRGNMQGGLPIVPQACQHYYIQKDTNWKECTHCGMLIPLFDHPFK